MPGLALLLASDGDTGLSVTAPDVRATAGLTVASALWAVLGTAAGALIRHLVAAIVGGIRWVHVVESLGTGFLGTAGRYLPGQAGHAIAQAPVGGEVLAVPLAAAVLVAYAATALAVAHLSLLRRDV